MATYKHEVIGAWLVAGALIAALATFLWVPSDTRVALPQAADIGRPGVSVVLHETAARDHEDAQAYEARNRAQVGTGTAVDDHPTMKMLPEPGV